MNLRTNFPNSKMTTTMSKLIMLQANLLRSHFLFFTFLFFLFLTLPHHSKAEDESAILRKIFEQESHKKTAGGVTGFNVLVDLCGIFKKTSIFEVRDLVLEHFGADRFRYIYHIDQVLLSFLLFKIQFSHTHTRSMAATEFCM